MITVGKILRKSDKESIAKSVISANGFDEKIKTINAQIEAIIRAWEKSRVIELFECSEKGAERLISSGCLNTYTCVAEIGDEGSLSWKDTGFRAASVCSSFKVSCQTMIPATSELLSLIETRGLLKTEKRKANQELEALLSGVTSSKLLLEQFPDFAKFVRIENSGAKALVPMATVEAVKSLLNVGGEK